MIPQITEINFPSYATLNSATITLSEMGDRNITTQIKIDGDIVPDFSGWELEFKGERFILPVKEPQAAKDNTSRRSIVDLTFSSWAVQEMKRYFFVEMTSIESGTAIADKYKASLGLNIENFVTAFNNVLNYYFNGNIEMDLFGSGTGIYSAEPAFFEIDYTHIWDVLQKIYEIYQVRWTITYDSSTEKYVIKVGYPAAEIDDHEFEYGYEGGLLRFERQVQDYDITNVLLGRGGEKNLPYRYFKKVDPQNPNWAGDPDAIPELKNIYFENLRDINFRRYVQGWKTNSNRILEEGDVVETYDSARGETDFAYAKGHTDERFNPVEYVKDDASIAIYGERWGALENADDIYPTIQGIEVDPYGRIDQVVDVEPVTTDDIEAMAADAAEVTNVAGASRTEWINYNSTLELDINGADFSVPEGKVGNLTIQNTWFDTILYAKRGNDQVNVDPADAVHELVSINTTLSYVTVVNRNTGTELPPAGIPAGNYFYKLHIVVKAEFESSMYNSVNVTVGVNGMKLTTSEGSANAWKPTFDIWVKNIWNTTQQSGESDEQYAARVWEPILGDRTGEEAKVAFSTGFLSISEDYNFTIASIPVVDRTKTIDGVASEWRITLIKSDAEYEATGKYIPNAETGGNASAGDYFFFTGIDMPWAYVLWAEEKLNAYKTAELAKLKQINPTWIIRIDKVRANTKEQGELEYLADRFASGAKLRVKDKRFTNGQVLTLYVQTVTYTWQEPSNGNPYLVPDIEVVLSDKVETVASPIDQLEGSVDLIQSTYAKISDIESAIRRVASPIFLKKTGESERSLSPTRFSSLMASESFRQGDIGGQGWGAYTDGEGHSVLEADIIVVRKDMRVNTLTVNQIAYLGGKQIISAAAMECTKVDDTDSGYVCYFDQKQGSVANLFKVDDIVLGQVWNADESEQRYYKRKVIAVSTDSITLSKDIADGDGVPQPKDIMVQYGSYSDTSRQYVIVRDVIGGGYERMLSGLTTVYANGNEYYFAGRQSGSTPRWFVGDANGQHASYQNGVLNITGRLSVTTQVDKGNGTYESLSNYLSNLQDQIDSTVQTWYVAGEPTLQNYPASTWPTVEDKNNHIGDLYYDSDTGKAYRFMLDGNTYKWAQLADEDIAAALALAQQNQTAIAGLQYLKAATNQGTLVQGGLVLTSMIQLGQTEQGVYKVYSGINGIMDPTALGNGIAAWYGGPMADIGADSTLTDFAKSLFRFDGSGYLASGNIKWDLNGNGEIPGISWNNGRITLSPDIYLQGGDRLTQIVDAVNRMYTQFAYDSHDNITVAPTHALYIPTTSPTYPIEGKVALYYDYNGNYSEIPSGGGVADIYDLTLRRGSVSVGPYNLGEQAADIDLASLFAGYATESWVSANFNKYVLPIASTSALGGVKVGGGLSINASTGVLSVNTGDSGDTMLGIYDGVLGIDGPSFLTAVQGIVTSYGYATPSDISTAISALNLGTASQKDAVSSITSGGAGLPTAGAIYTFVNNAVTAAQPYKGVSSTAITDGGTEMPTIAGYTTRTKGDVVAYNKKEFIWEGDKWRELGDEGSYALKTVQVIAGTGLAGGGAISQDVTLSLSSATQASLALADSALQASDLDGYVNAISQGSGNYVTGITKSGKTLTITRATLPTTIALSNVTGADDLKAIEALTGTSGLLKKTAANTWTLDTNTYLTSSDHKALTLKVGSTTIGSDYNALVAKTYTITAQNITDTIGSTTYAPYHADGYLPLTAGSGKALTGDLYLDASSANRYIYSKTSSGNVTIVRGNNSKQVFIGTGSSGTYLQTDGSVYMYSGSKSVLFNGSQYRPSSDSDISLGSSSYKWSALYATTVNATDIIASGLATLPNIHAATSLSVPKVAPDTTAAWYDSSHAYLWSDSGGNYAESASGGGGGGGELLTVTKNGLSWLSYDGSEAVTLNLVVPTTLADLTDDSTHRLVTDTQIVAWNDKATQSWVDQFVEEALEDYLPLTAGSGKVLTGDLYFDASSADKDIIWTTSSNTTTRALRLSSAGNLLVGTTDYNTNIYGNILYLRWLNSSQQELMVVGTSSSFRPTSNNNIHLGGANYRWSDVYATTFYGNLDLSYLQNADDLKAIEALSGTGLAKRTADNTWELTNDIEATSLKTTTEEDAMFTYRRTPSVAVGDMAKVTGVKGKSIVWNQLVDTGTTSVTIPTGHRYYAIINGVRSVGTSTGAAISVTGGTDMVFDLTQMFGSTAAATMTAADFEALYPLDYYDYNAGSLQSNKTAAIETVGWNRWDEEWENGTINLTTGESSGTGWTQIKTKNYVPVTQNIEYYLKTPFVTNNNSSRAWAVFYDSNKQILTTPSVTGASATSANGVALRGAFTAPTNAAYMKFYMQTFYGATYNHDICLNLSNTSRNGEYQPYKKDTLELNITSLVPANKPTLRLNQLVGETATTTSSAYGYTITRTDTQITIQNVSMSTPTTGNWSVLPGLPAKLTVGHKYYVKSDWIRKYPAVVTNVCLNLPSPGDGLHNLGTIFTCSSIGTNAYFRVKTAIPLTTLPVGGTLTFYLNLIDLTDMYGAGNEPTNAAEIDELIGLDSVPYNTGSDIPNRIFPVGMKSVPRAYDECSGDTAIKRIKHIRLDGSQTLQLVNWRKTTTSVGFLMPYALLSDARYINPSVSTTLRANIQVASYDECYSGTYDHCVGLYLSGSYSLAVRLPDPTLTTAALVNAYLAEHPIDVYYELATPEHFDLLNPIPQLVVCDPGGTQRRLPEDTASSVSAPMVCDFQYGVNPRDLYGEEKSEIAVLNERLDTFSFADLASHPTTLAGYGITDAYTKTEADTEYAKYLPLYGGTMTGNITFSSSSDKSIYANNGTLNQRMMLMSSSGNLTIGYDLPTNSKTLYLDGYSIYLRYGTTKENSILMNGSNGTISGLKNMVSATTETYNLGNTGNRWLGVYANTVNAATGFTTAGTLSVTGVSTFTGNLVPNATNATDIGSSSKKFKNLYLAGTATVNGIASSGNILPSSASLTLGSSSNKWAALWTDEVETDDLGVNGAVLTSLIPDGALDLGSSSTRWGSLFALQADVSNALAIPKVAPSNPDANKAYLYVNPTGNYAESLNS